MALYFAGTLFVSAGLLFLVQPMVGKMVLPGLGGTPAVWNACMVFFQGGLLAGYAYAHAGPRWLGLRRHTLLHIGLILLPLIAPMEFDPEGAPPSGVFPVLWLWGVLTLQLGLPFVLVASTGPLLQRWFAETTHARRRDPYFLYAASNLGSMIGLLCYPFVVEPMLDLDEQVSTWTTGYAALVVLTIGAAGLLWRRPASLLEAVENAAPARPAEDRGPTPWHRVRWVALALAPSSLMLSVTTHITTDLAAMPLLWVIPLSLYLLSYILVFTRWQRRLHPATVRIMPLAVLILVLLYLTEASELRAQEGLTPILAVAGLHLAGFFVIALVCHGELARTRPAAEHLTEFYLWLAVGGVLGGLFNSLIAPLVFTGIAEYPLGLLAACFLRPDLTSSGQELPAIGSRPLHSLQDREIATLGGLTVALVLIARWVLHLPAGPLAVGFMFGPPLIWCYLLQHDSRRFALGMSVILLVSLGYHGVHGAAEYRTRSFFGVHRVTRDSSFRYLVHGNTVHGQQSLLPGEQMIPRTYYHPRGPIGHFFRIMEDDPRLARVGIIGLGTGALACYAEDKQHWTFFEIDPAVERIARNPALFSYLQMSRGRIDFVLGDARVSLKEYDQHFGLIVVDAFSSDAIPVHLLTREALDLYRSRLRPDGVLAFHISNRYLDLQPVLANLAAAGDRPMTCLARADLDPKDEPAGKWPSHWVVLTFDPVAAARLEAIGWQKVPPDNRYRVWTDRYSNVLQVLGRSE